MKKFLHFTVVFLLFTSLSFGDSVTLDFRLEKKNESIETITAIDRKTGKSVFFEKAPALTINDIKKAECRFERLDGYYIRAKSIYDEHIVFTDDMAPIINFHLTEEGKKKIFKISTQNDRTRLGIFLNNRLIMTPVIYGRIDGDVFSLDASGVIGIKESKELVEKINKEK